MPLQKPDKSLLELALKWLNGKISAKEKEKFEQWYNSFDDTYHEKNSNETIDELEARLHQSIINKAGIGKAGKTQIISLWPRIAAAASVLLFLAAGGWFLFHKTPSPQTAQNQIHDIAPGSNKAILTSNGKKYMLDTTRNGIISKRGNVAITKTADGRVAYSAPTIPEAGTGAIYDTLTIPRGGQHQLILADGSKVWLNAATQIRYPENFTGKERKVELLYGEAYFEVVHDPAKPFRVLSNRQVIEDIGTHFNVSAYLDEPLFKTTLLEGSVKITKGSAVTTLIPGQAAITAASNNQLKVERADLEETVAWKNGYFRFNDERIETIMRQLSRWYNIDVQYEGSVSTEEFNAKISRFKNISQVLKVLELTKTVHFKVEGRRVTITQ